MKTGHLSEKEIQQFVLEKEGRSLEMMDHIQQCESCRLKVETYQLVFANFDSHFSPTFDFNLTELVMKQLPKPVPKVSKTTSFLYFFVVISILMVGIILYPLLAYLSNVFQNVTPMTINLVFATMALLLLFVGLDFYFSYKKQIKMLNFY